MGRLSIFKRSGGPAVGNEGAGDAVQRARTRARQRLIGAVVLVGIGVIGFPLVFETQPRPIPVDIPIEIPRKDNAPPLAMPPARAPASETAPLATAPAVAPMTAPRAATPEVITESREEAGREIASSPAPAASTPAAAAPAPVPAKPTTTATVTNDGARAQALLEGRAGKPPGDGRFVVQVGAFADATAAHETRLKVEKLGLKTYTQVASTAAGGRIRVRVGPFGSRDEADKAVARARSAGLPAVVLTL